MENILTLHPEKEASVTLTGSQWLALMLKLAGRGHDTDAAALAEASILRQIGEA